MRVLSFYVRSFAKSLPQRQRTNRFFGSLNQSQSRRSSSLFGLGKLNHVAIACTDLEKTSTFYKDVLGARVSDAVPQPDHGVYTVFVELGNTKIELLHPLGEKSPIQGFLDKNKNGGMHHLCIEVDDMDAAVSEVKARGVRCLSAQPSIGAHGKPVIFLHPKDCGGVLIELEQA